MPYTSIIDRSFSLCPIAIVLGFVGLGCGPSEEGLLGKERAVIAANVQGVADTVLVLATLGGDTVFLRQLPGDNRLLWASGSGPGRQEWRSTSFGAARPVVRLAFIDPDSIPDLFFTVEYEEFIFGRVLLGGPAEVQEAFRSSENACRVPELRDVTGDGRLEILDFQTGALAVEECSGDPYAQRCQELFPTEWISVWSVQDGSQIRASGPGLRGFYANLALDYQRAAGELATILNAGDPGGRLSPRCDQSMVVALERMASRAESIANQR
jgi:hypothetical protein